MNKRLQDCLNYFVLNWEGTACEEVKDDPGGRTKCGIIQTTYDAHRKAKGLPLQSVCLLSDEEMNSIYEHNYWNTCGANSYPAQLDLCMFDIAVNMGTGQAVKMLRSIFGMSPGTIVTPELLAAVGKTKDIKTVCNKLLELRRERYHLLVNKNPKLGKFLNGWLARVSALQIKIDRME